ncbi:twin-arginine translocase subunit TatC [Cellulomonas bogoriensis]|uniref:Sec-independent protein translocase protein TatC n=1 Tax=Cellulomonas bogoriensis 69B4 = DSM 16987 TaxID=1386082 RepID=A0A0A0BQC0_9CELL|nr:twin-arginine translocase subunit TatC [Cellulomonas bogoriensis]KGM09852.1 preprotein translocase subunit TatC [Cellulomonas bogoriensis 69B4 = DSM 16987]
MPLRDHLRELRRRVVLAAAGLVVGAVAGWFVFDHLYAAVQAPVVAFGRTHDQLVALNFDGIAAPLDMRIKMSLFVGVIVSSPWWIYQLWAFVTPGLTRRERWYTVGFVAAAVPLFLTGAGLAWWVLPQAVAILAGFTPAESVNLIGAQGYVSFVMRMVLAFGLAFLLPVLMVGMNVAGVVRGRTWLVGWRWAVMIAFVFAAMATPTGDAITMFALAIPICLLYFSAVGICLLVDRRRAHDPHEESADAHERLG